MLDTKSMLILKILAKQSAGGSYKIFESADLISSLPTRYRTDSDGIRHILTHLEHLDMISIKYDDDDVYCLSVLPYGLEVLENTKLKPGRSEKTPKNSLPALVFILSFIGAFLGALISYFLTKFI